MCTHHSHPPHEHSPYCFDELEGEGDEGCHHFPALPHQLPLQIQSCPAGVMIGNYCDWCPCDDGGGDGVFFYFL